MLKMAKTILVPYIFSNFFIKSLLFEVDIISPCFNMESPLFTQENTLKIALDNLLSLVFHFPSERVCYTNPPNPSDFKGVYTVCDKDIPSLTDKDFL